MASETARDAEHDEERAVRYAFGLLDSGTRATFERHLADCEHCRELVQIGRDVAARLDAEAPAVDPGPRLRTRIWREIGEESRRSGRRPSFWARFLRRPMARQPALLAPIAAVFVVALTLGAVLGRQFTLNEALLVVPLAGSAGGDSHVIIHRSGATEVALRHVADPPPGTVYVAWVRAPDGPPVSAGTYDDGNGTFPLAISALGKIVEITVEAKPGASTPSAAPILSAPVVP